MLCGKHYADKYNLSGRYLGRPVIATSRIDSYDEDSETVTFHYNRHEDDKYIQETIPALDFYLFRGDVHKDRHTGETL